MIIMQKRFRKIVVANKALYTKEFRCKILYKGEDDET